MMNTPPHILIVDDEELNREVILEILAECPYQLSTAENGRIAWEMLQRTPRSFDVILLDRMMPEMDGMELLRRIKADAVLQHCPVIMQTAKSAKEDVLEGIKAGAYYYLTKPFEEERLLSIVSSALEERQHYLTSLELLKKNALANNFVEEAQFRFRTVEEASQVAALLSRACKDPASIVNGLSELLVNAVEHGNLGISYEEKSELLKNGTWLEEIKKRLQMDEYRSRYAHVKLQRTGSLLEITITDQGAGFDWRKYMDFDPERVMDSHGRGIALANCQNFATVEYLGRGNVVKLYIQEQLLEPETV